MALDPATHKDALTEMVLIDFPSHFAKSELETSDLNRRNQRDVQIVHYLYSFLRPLNKNGVHVFICSNSWLMLILVRGYKSFSCTKRPLFCNYNHAAEPQLMLSS